jgi:uncharacterized protein
MRLSRHPNIGVKYSSALMKTFALRLTPGQDLKTELQAFTQDHDLQAGFILTAVGSLQHAQLRFAGQSVATSLPGPWEIVSLVGTLCQSGLHLHIALANAQGEVRGGHLMPGCLIHTTAEIVLGEGESSRFVRVLDLQTGYLELTLQDVGADIMNKY